MYILRMWLLRWCVYYVLMFILYDFCFLQFICTLSVIYLHIVRYRIICVASRKDMATFVNSSAFFLLANGEQCCVP